jgi:tetratricopeptide (TPR) repeat protein
VLTASGNWDSYTHDDHIHSTIEFCFSGDPMRKNGFPRLYAAAAALAMCGIATWADAGDLPAVTTNSAIALSNLDHQIAQMGSETGVEDLLLVRSRFLGDYEALSRASVLGESRNENANGLLRRARTRAAVHRFADALADVIAAQRAGAKNDAVVAVRSSILVAIGRAGEVIPELEANLARHPGFSSRTALAIAYAAVGRLNDADRLYSAALADLDTTLPFPYASIYFARGLMWAEQGGDLDRGENFYKQALVYVPEFVEANIHLAEIEVARGDIASATARLVRVVQSSNEPEATALLGMLHLQAGQAEQGAKEIALAQKRFESLLALYPLAFADHATEFYLGPGANPERAWLLAQQNLANRPTDRAVALAIKAAEAGERYPEACALRMNSGPMVEAYLRSLNWQVQSIRPQKN